ncbi:trithorax group protein osa-like [Lytechinus pictus]|uniref:trithorax group protein osa-like n=1 Tax=Lytechinus pictus TaxID=7653 RepID=UPI0030BA2332
MDEQRSAFQRRRAFYERSLIQSKEPPVSQAFEAWPQHTRAHSAQGAVGQSSQTQAGEAPSFFTGGRPGGASTQQPSASPEDRAKSLWANQFGFSGWNDGLFPPQGPHQVTPPGPQFQFGPRAQVASLPGPQFQFGPRAQVASPPGPQFQFGPHAQVDLHGQAPRAQGGRPAMFNQTTQTPPHSYPQAVPHFTQAQYEEMYGVMFRMMQMMPFGGIGQPAPPYGNPVAAYGGYCPPWVGGRYPPQYPNTVAPQTSPQGPCDLQYGGSNPVYQGTGPQGDGQGDPVYNEHRNTTRPSVSPGYLGLPTRNQPPRVTRLRPQDLWCCV